MKKAFILILIFFFAVADLLAQITGDTVVCAGNIYTYSANILNADSFYWTTPVGWYNLQGQGTSQITANCNISAGDICVEGFDSLGVSIGQQCLTTTWGGGGQGWDVQPSSFTYCPSIWQNNFNPSQSIQIIPNGTGGNCGSCGGLPNSKLAYCVYNGNTFIGYPNGVPFAFNAPGYPNTINWHVEYVDTSNGLNLPNAIIIQSGCGGSGNNSIQGTALYNVPSITVGPNPACIGSHLYIYCTNCFGFTPAYTIISGLAFNPNPPYYPIVTANTWSIYCEPTMYNGCPGIPDWFNGTAVNCSTPIIGDSIVCPGYRYTYTHPIQSGYQGTWILPVGWYDVSGQGTSTLSATCNTNVGNIGFVLSESGYTIDTIFKAINFSGIQGWNVQPNIFQSCDTSTAPFAVHVIPNGTGGGASCPVGCGSGLQHPNIVYAVYDSPWPNGNFIGVADSSSLIPFFTTTLQYFVYEVDTTNGVNFPNAILITGGCNIGTINNVITHDSIPLTTTLSTSPSNACIGDTISLLDSNNFQNPVWVAISDLNILTPNSNPATAIITGISPAFNYTGIDSATGCAVNQSLQMNINSCFYPVASFYSSDSIFCEKQYVDFFNLTTNNPTSWQWIFNGAVPDTSTEQNPDSIYYSSNGNYDVILIACNNYGCDTLILSNFIHVDAIPYVYLGSDTLICDTASIQLNAGIGFDSYLWNNGMTTQQITVNSQGVYSVEVQLGTCLSSDTIIVATQLCALPLISFASTDTNFCEKNCINFFDSSLNNPISWQWNFPNATPDTSTLQNPTNICYNTYGNFDVSLIVCNQFGCDTLLLNNFITCYQQPYDSIWLINDTLFSLPAAAYQWYEVSTGLINGATSQFYLPLQQGSFYCIVTDSNGCGTSSNVIVITSASLLSINDEQSFTISPNPTTSNTLHIGYLLPKNKSGVFSIYDVTGQIVFKYNLPQWSNEQVFNLPKLDNGVYQCIIKSNNFIATQKLIVIDRE